CEKIAPSELGQAPGDERLDLAEEADPHAREDTEGEIVPLEALEIPGDRLADPADPDDDDRDGQGQDGWTLGGARDHVAGEGHQPDPQEDGEGTEQHGRRDACTRQPRVADQFPQRVHGRAACFDTATARPSSIRTIRSAERASSGLCAISNTARSAPSSRIEAAIDSPLSASRFAVGSSRITSWAQRASARARARRRVSPADKPRAPSPMSLSYPRGRSATTSSRPAAFDARSICSMDAEGLPIAMLSRTEPRNTVGRCGTHATFVRHPWRSSVARSVPPTVMVPPSGVRRPRSNAATVLLPAPLGPISATTSPRLMVRSNPSR